MFPALEIHLQEIISLYAVKDKRAAVLINAQHTKPEILHEFEDTIYFFVREERAGLRLAGVQHVRSFGAMIVEHEVTPRLYLLGSGVAVHLDGEKRREVILPRPLEPTTRERTQRRSHFERVH